MAATAQEPLYPLDARRELIDEYEDSDGFSHKTFRVYKNGDETDMNLTVKTSPKLRSKAKAAVSDSDPLYPVDAHRRLLAESIDGDGFTIQDWRLTHGTDHVDIKIRKKVPGAGKRKREDCPAEDEEARRKRAKHEEEAHMTDPEFLALLVRTPVRHLVRFPLNQEGKETVYVVRKHEKVVDVMEALVQKGFLSAPVLQSGEDRFWGFVDLSDIVRYVVRNFDVPLERQDDLWNLVKTHEHFLTASVGDIIQHPLSRRNPFRTVKVGFSLLTALETLSREHGVHRVAVIGPENELVSLVTQSQVVDFFWKNVARLGAKRAKPIGQIAGVMREVYHVEESSRAIEAFKLMAEKNVTGVAVVSDDGILIDNMSVRDLKAIEPTKVLFFRLYESCGAFLAQLRDSDAVKRPAIPVTVKATDTIETTLGLFNERRVHRIYVVDDNNRAVGIVSLRAIIRDVLTT